MSRGPKPTQLANLFRLKYQEDITDREILAKKLGVSVKTVYEYENRLEKKLVEKIQQVSEDRLHLICPECLEAKVYEDPESGERVCHSCGLTLPNEESDERLPFDTTYALESELAADKSLGGTLPKKGYLQVLARSGRGSEDLGIRARQTRVMAETNEHPSLVKMLKRAYEVSKRFNLEGDFTFNNDLGRNVRRVFWLARELDININSAAETAFWFTLCQYKKQKLFPDAENSLKINQTLLGLTFKLNHLLLTVKEEFQPEAFTFEE